ncbi:MAG TPA: STAS domain-containing protein [Solirubrobacteraceae bacterium]
MPEPGFQLRVGRSSGALVVAPSGDLDIGTAPELAGALAGAAGDDVVVDLRAVAFIDSSGVAGVLEARRRAQESGGRLRVVEGPPEVQRVLELVSLDRTLEWTEPPADVTWLDGA